MFLVNLGRRFGTGKMHLTPPPCFPFYGGGSVVVDSVFIVATIVCGVLCLVLVLLINPSSIAIILMGKRELVALFKLSS